MKNKKLTYFLVVIVLGLWGLILYRVFDAVAANDDNQLPVLVHQVKDTYGNFSIPNDTAKLMLNYRDPFGLPEPKDTVTKRNQLLSSKKITQTVRPAINWSFISYSGYIRNPASKKLIALVSINGQNVTLAEGETKVRVKLVKNMRDSIKVSYAGKTKFILLKTATL
jgi:hypothetical protein